MKNTLFKSLKLSASSVLRPSIVVATSYLLFLIIMTIVRGYSAFDYIHVGTVWSQHNPGGTWGYDGQFYYQLTRDPIGAYAFMDDAPYRYQRILYPLVVALLSLRNPVVIPYMLLFVNWLAIVLSVEFVARLLIKRHLSPWFSLAIGLYFGQAAGLTFDTAEPFALFLICAGFWLLDGKHGVWAALTMGLAALARDTAVLFPAMLIMGFLLTRQWRQVAFFIILSVLPLVIWLVSIVFIFGRTGLTFTPPFEHTPFAGIFAFAQVSRKFWLMVFMILLPTVGSAALASFDLLRLRWKYWSLLAIWWVNILMVVFLSRFSYLDMISCGRISTGVVVAGVLYGLMTRNKVVLWAMQAYSLTLLVYLAAILFPLSSFIM